MCDEKLGERIEVNPKILGGKPVIKGTRIPVYLILELLSAGYDFKRIIESYPTLTEEDIKAAVETPFFLSPHDRLVCQRLLLLSLSQPTPSVHCMIQIGSYIGPKYDSKNSKFLLSDITSFNLFPSLAWFKSLCCGLPLRLNFLHH
jgi:uncharacterized protein (DUF433 family)